MMDNVQVFLNGKVELRPGDCRDVIKAMPDSSIDSVVCDPPYALVSIVKRFGGENAKPVKVDNIDASNDLKAAYARASAGFMGKAWDTGEVAFADTFWREVLRVLKPGGHVVAFSGTRTYHRMAVAIEDAGFEIRDQLAWCYGSGFPKSHDVSKAIDKAAGAVREKVRVTNVRNPKATGGGKDGMEGATRPWIEAALERGYHEKDGDEAATPAAQEWQGWGTALKPAWEPICLARKPLIGTVAENVLAHGTGALNIDGCRVQTSDDLNGGCHSENAKPRAMAPGGAARNVTAGSYVQPTGRWPANIVHDGSDEVLAGFPVSKSSGGIDTNGHDGEMRMGRTSGQGGNAGGLGDEGSAARFFYTAKADKQDRFGSKHPTVKPVDLCQWLVRLVTPKGGIVLDPFAGSGTTGEAAWREGMRCILIERETDYQADIADRLTYADKGPMTRATKIASKRKAPGCALPLFANDNQDDAEAA